MSETTALFTQIALLPPAERLQVLFALRYDHALWEAALQAAPELMTSSRPARPTTWSPAGLALHRLGFPIPSESLRQQAAHPLPEAWQQRVAAAFQDFLDAPAPDEPDLPTAGLLALALRERRRLAGCWERLPDDLAPHPLPLWRRPLACLLGITPDPDALLIALCPASRENDLPDLLLDGMLCQPWETGQLAAPLAAALPHLTPSQRRHLLERLTDLRHPLATVLATHVTSPVPTEPDEDSLAFLALIARLTDDAAQAHHLLSRAWDASRRREAELLAQIAETAQAQGDLTTALNAWEQATHLAPDWPHFLVRRVQALLQAGQVDAAARLLPADRETLWLSIARADLAAYTDDQAALQAALQDARRLPLDDLPADWLERLAEHATRIEDHAACADFAAALSRRVPQHPRVWRWLSQARYRCGDLPGALEAARLGALIAPRSPQMHRTLATLLEANHDWAAACDAWQQVLALTPQDADALHGFARCALQANRPENALHAAHLWLTRQADAPEAHLLSGQALLALGRPTEAGRHFRQATILRPDDPAVWLTTARAHRAAGDRQAALDTLRAATLAVPHTIEVLLLLGELYLEDGQPTQALPPLQEAHRRLAQASEPSETLSRRAALALARALTALGRHHEAREVLEPAWRAAPEVIEVTTLYGHLALADQDPQAALQALAPVVTLPETPSQALLDFACAALTCRADPQSVIAAMERLLCDPQPPLEARYWMAEALRRSGRPEAARQHYRQALQAADDAPDTLRADLLTGLGLACQAMNDPSAAIQALEAAVTLAPDRVDALQALAEVCPDTDTAWAWACRARQAAPADEDLLDWFAGRAIALGHPQEAIQALEQALQLAPERPDLWLRLAKADPERAWEACHHVISLPQADADALHAAARHLLQLNDTDGARDALCRALEQDESPALWLTLAEVHHRRNEVTEVAQALQRARTLASGHPDSLLAVADGYLRLGRVSAALACLEDALHQHPQPAIIHAQLSELYLTHGDLAAALTHAREHVRLAPSLSAALTLARVHVLRLEDKQAIEVLTTALHQPLPETDRDTLVEAWCLLGECHLSADAEVAAADALTQVCALDERHPRVLALRSRLQHRRGDHESAALTFDALDLQAPASPCTRLAVALTACELGRWEIALRLLDALQQAHPTTPRFAFEHARALVKRAEAQVLAGELDILRHAPGAQALAASALRTFEKAILHAGRLTRNAETGEPHPLVVHWYARGQAVWRPSPEHAQALARFADHPDGLAAYLSALRRAGQPAQAVDAARTAWQRLRPHLTDLPPHTQTQLALSLRHDLPTEALQLAQQAARHPMASPTDHAALALIARQHGEHELARTAWEAALHAWPDEPRWHHHLARLYLDERPPAPEVLQRAAVHLERALNGQPDDRATRLLLAQTLTHLGRPDRALEVLDEIQPSTSEVYLARARACFALGNLEGAREAAESVRRHAPSPSEDQAAALLLAQIALQQGEPAQAIALTRQVLRQQPTPEAQHVLARAQAANGDPEGALRTLEQAFDPATAPFEVALEHARLIETVRGTAEALPVWQTLTRRFPDRLEGWIALAQVAESLKQGSQAVQAAQTALDLAAKQTAPIATQAMLHRLLGRLHRHTGQLDLALEHLTTAVRLAPDDVESYLTLADVYQARREPALAADVLQQAVALRPKDAALLFRLGMLHKEQGDLDAAEHLFRQAAQLDPENLTYRHQWAAVLSARTLQRTRSSEAT